MIISLFFLGTLVLAANNLDVVINEVSWMGNKESSNNEWMELYNNTASRINLEGWILKSSDGTPIINLGGEIQGNDFYLLERTDDNTLTEVPADQIYTGALGNSGERLELYDNLGNLIDLVDCGSGWFGGDNITKQTMERKTDGNWQTSQNPGGTPKTQNGIAAAIEVQSQSSSTLQQEELKSVFYPSGVAINEILPSPEGADAENEWIEILNQGNLEIDLANWKISDTVGAIKVYTFPEGTKIPSQGYLVLTRPISKITLNNDGDGLKLTSPDGKIVDSAEYTKAPKGQSFNRIESSWVWSDALTPGLVNKNPSKTSEKESETELGILKTTTYGTNSELQSKEGLAAVNQSFKEIQGQKIPKSFLPYFIAVSLAIFSGAAIFLLKRLLKD